MKIFAFAGVLASGLLLSGCVWDDMVNQVEASFTEPPPVQTASVPTSSSANTSSANISSANSIPWQLTPASAASRAQGETTILADVPTVGRVRGTEKAIAEWNQKLVPYTNDDKIVTACRNAFEPQAKSAGAYSLEAAAAGPKRHIPDGWTQQVFFRILYADPQEKGVEVRQASIACTVDAGGTLKRAAPV